jgi:hypothetical protein
MSVLMLYCPFPGIPCAGDRTHTTYNKRLLAVSPDMAKLVAAVTLHETRLGFAHLYPVATWQRLVSLNTSWDCDVLGKVIRKMGMFTVVVPSAGDQWVADICFTLTASKPRFINPSEMSSAGVVNGRCHITAFIGFWDLG